MTTTAPRPTGAALIDYIKTLNADLIASPRRYSLQQERPVTASLIRSIAAGSVTPDSLTNRDWFLIDQLAADCRRVNVQVLQP